MDFQIDPRITYSHPTNGSSTKKERQLASLRKSSHEFEALLVNQMFKAMRKSVPEGGLFKKDSSVEMFQEMLDMERARATTAGKGIGIADAIYKQMSSIVEKTK